jgi:hypothetical protein
MPVQGGPQARVTAWMAGLGRVQGDFVHKSLRQWMRTAGGKRSFTVLRHPLARAHAAFCDRVLNGGAPELRGALNRTFALDLPPPHKTGQMGLSDHQAAFLAFLRFAKMTLSGQTGMRVDAHMATQTAVLQGFAQFQGPDLVLREDRLADGLRFLCAETGHDCPPLPDMPDTATFPLALVRTPDIDSAAHDAYARDFLGYGFADAP